MENIHQENIHSTTKDDLISCINHTYDTYKQAFIGNNIRVYDRCIGTSCHQLDQVKILSSKLKKSILLIYNRYTQLCNDSSMDDDNENDNENDNDDDTIKWKMKWIYGFVKQLYDKCKTLSIQWNMEQWMEHQRISDEDYFNIEADSSTQFTEEDKLSKFQTAVIYCLNLLQEYGWKRMDDACYEEVYVIKIKDHFDNIFWCIENDYNTMNDDDEVLDRKRTFHWRKVDEIENIIHKKLIDRQLDKDMWLTITHSARTYHDVIKYLTSWKTDEHFPSLTTLYHVRSFLNGVLVLYHDRVQFYSYDDDNIQEVFQKAHSTSCIMYKQEFEKYSIMYPDFMQIPTPAFDSIFSKQLLEEDVIRNIYGLFGRLLHPLGEYDKWQVIPFFKGVAQSGKSTLGNIIKYMFHSKDVGIISSNIEEKFGLETIIDKQLWICYEVTQKWGIDRSDFQSMISGDEMSISRKYKKQLHILWKTPGIMFGNETGGWLDCAGSIVRRIACIQFDKQIVELDADLERKIIQEIPLIICKCHCAYLSMLKTFGDHGFWENIPDYFKKMRYQMEALTNPLKAFIRSDEFILDERAHMKVCDFMRRMRDYFKTMKTQTTYDDDQVKFVLTSEKIEYKKATLMLDIEKNRMVKTNWLVGIKPNVI